MMPTEIEIKEAEKLMGRKLKNKPGTCFDSVSYALIEYGFFYPISETKFRIVKHKDYKKVRVCHGIIIENWPISNGKEISHAWIEFNKKNIRYAYDAIWDVANNAEHFRKVLKLSYVKEYRLGSFYYLWKKYNYPGPWDAKIKELT